MKYVTLCTVQALVDTVESFDIVVSPVRTAILCADSCTLRTVVAPRTYTSLVLSSTCRGQGRKYITCQKMHGLIARETQQFKRWEQCLLKRQIEPFNTYLSISFGILNSVLYIFFLISLHNVMKRTSQDFEKYFVPYLNFILVGPIWGDVFLEFSKGPSVDIERMITSQNMDSMRECIIYHEIIWYWTKLFKLSLKTTFRLALDV